MTTENKTFTEEDVRTAHMADFYNQPENLRQVDRGRLVIARMKISGQEYLDESSPHSDLEAKLLAEWFDKPETQAELDRGKKILERANLLRLKSGANVELDSPIVDISMAMDGTPELIGLKLK